MIAGKYKVSELLEMGVQEAVSFSPRFIVNGVGQIKSQADGWGIAPAYMHGPNQGWRNSICHY